MGGTESQSRITQHRLRISTEGEVGWALWVGGGAFVHLSRGLPLPSLRDFFLVSVKPKEHLSTFLQPRILSHMDGTGGKNNLISDSYSFMN